jgi:hypothetical protein
MYYLFSIRECGVQQLDGTVPFGCGIGGYRVLQKDEQQHQRKDNTADDSSALKWA